MRLCRVYVSRETKQKLKRQILDHVKSGVEVKRVTMAKQKRKLPAKVVEEEKPEDKVYNSLKYHRISL